MEYVCDCVSTYANRFSCNIFLKQAIDLTLFDLIADATMYIIFVGAHWSTRVLFYFVVMFWAWTYRTFCSFGLCLKFRHWDHPPLFTQSIYHVATRALISFTWTYLFVSIYLFELNSTQFFLGLFGVFLLESCCDHLICIGFVSF